MRPRFKKKKKNATWGEGPGSNLIAEKKKSKTTKQQHSRGGQRNNRDVINETIGVGQRNIGRTLCWESSAWKDQLGEIDREKKKVLSLPPENLGEGSGLLLGEKTRGGTRILQKKKRGDKGLGGHLGERAINRKGGA